MTIYIPRWIIYPLFTFLAWLFMLWLVFKIAGEDSIFLGIGFMLLIWETIRMFFAGLTAEEKYQDSLQKDDNICGQKIRRF